MGRTRDETGQRQTSESTAIRLAFQKDHSGNSLYDGMNQGYRKASDECYNKKILFLGHFVAIEKRD